MPGTITPTMLARQPRIADAAALPPYDPARQYAEVLRKDGRVLATTWWYSTQTFDGSGKPVDGDQVDSD